jgi:hypothetical protein
MVTDILEQRKMRGTNYLPPLVNSDSKLLKILKPDWPLSILLLSKLAVEVS